MLKPLNIPIKKNNTRAARLHIPASYNVLLAALVVVCIVQVIQFQELRRKTASTMNEFHILRQEFHALQDAAAREHEPEEATIIETKSRFYTGKVFSAAKYMQWAVLQKAPAAPELVRFCAAQPVCLVGGKAYVRGLTGKLYPCKPDWQHPALTPVDL
jgi:hypothetical protein